MILYRGDNIFNKLTQPQLYRFDGIRSKAFGKGDPAYVDRNGLLNCIRKHIKPESLNDEEFYNTTDFISFSKELNRALYWISDKNKLQLEECDRRTFTETRYLFELYIPDSDITILEKGIYSFKYMCNPSLKSENSPDPVFKSALPLMYGRNLCPICEIKYVSHEIILIDTCAFLQANGENEKFIGASENAALDQEWLVLPFDAMDKTGFKHARIPRADFWTVRHYKGTGEVRPGD